MEIGALATSFSTTWANLNETLSQTLKSSALPALISHSNPSFDCYVAAALREPLGSGLIGIGALTATAIYLGRRQAPYSAKKPFHERAIHDGLMIASLTSSAAALSVLWTMPEVPVLSAALSFGGVILATMACEKNTF